MPFCLGIPHTCLHKTREIWVPRGGIKDNSPSACANVFIDNYWQIALQTPTFTSSSLTLIALTYFSIAGSYWPRGSPSSWCQSWPSLAGKHASHPALIWKHRDPSSMSVIFIFWSSAHLGPIKCLPLHLYQQVILTGKGLIKSTFSATRVRLSFFSFSRSIKVLFGCKAHKDLSPWA